MKNCVNRLAGFFVVLSMVFCHNVIAGIFWNSTFDPVERIKERSNLTEDDRRDLRKLVSLIRFAPYIGKKGSAGFPPLAAGASIIAAYIYKPDLFNQVFANMPSVESSWKLAAGISFGALASVYASYKYWYPRTQEALLHKVTEFIEMCKEFGLDAPELNKGAVEKILGNIVPGSLNRLQDVLNNLSLQALTASDIVRETNKDTDLTNSLIVCRNNIAQLEIGVTLPDSLVGKVVKGMAELEDKEAKIKQTQEQTKETFMKRMIGWYDAGKKVATDVASFVEKAVTHGPWWVGTAYIGYQGYRVVKGVHGYWYLPKANLP